jgi:hypothetical protein
MIMTAQRVVIRAAIASAALFVITSVSADEFITNGSFETGKDIPLNWNGGAGGYVAVDLSSGPSNTDLPGWSGNFTTWYDANSAEYSSAQDGTRFLNLNGANGENVLSQSFAVSAGNVYTVSYYERARDNDAAYMDTTLRVAAGTLTGAAGTPTSVEAGPVASIVQSSAKGKNEWTLHSFTFTPSANTTATLTFGNHYTDPGGPGDNNGVFLDNVSITGKSIALPAKDELESSDATVPDNELITADVLVSLSNPSFENPGKGVGGAWAQFGSPWDVKSFPLPRQQIETVAGGAFTKAPPGGGKWCALLSIDNAPVKTPLVQSWDASVSAGDTLSVSFYLGRAKGQKGGKGIAFFKVGKTLYTQAFDTSSLPADSWQRTTMTKKISNSGNLSLGFCSSSASGNNSFLDNISDITVMSGSVVTR